MKRCVRIGGIENKLHWRLDVSFREDERMKECRKTTFLPVDIQRRGKVKNRTWTSLLFVGLIAMGATSLTACGGGGGSVIQPPPVDPPVDPVDPVDPPTSAYSVGPHAINGIDRIPQSAVKLTREEMQPKFVIAEYEQRHAREVSQMACESYIQSGDCGSQAGIFRNQDGSVTTKTGTSPFTVVLDDPIHLDSEQWVADQIAKMPEAKIVNYPIVA